MVASMDAACRTVQKKEGIGRGICCSTYPHIHCYGVKRAMHNSYQRLFVGADLYILEQCIIILPSNHTGREQQTKKKNKKIWQEWDSNPRLFRDCNTSNWVGQARFTWVQRLRPLGHLALDGIFAEALRTCWQQIQPGLDTFMPVWHTTALFSFNGKQVWLFW